MAEIFESQP